jgi:hypothetical protein
MVNFFNYIIHTIALAEIILAASIIIIIDNLMNQHKVPRDCASWRQILDQTKIFRISRG